MKILLDTDICVFLLRDRLPNVRKKFDSYDPDDVCVSSISVAELYYGIAKSHYKALNKSAVDNFLAFLKLLPFDRSAVNTYGELRAALEKKGTPIGSLDMLIAAQAVSHNVTLVTNNLREFKRVPGLEVESWV